MIDERREAQAAEYVLGALPAEELPDFKQALLSNLELQLFVHELRAGAEMLPFALPAVTPPAALKERILGRIGGSAVTAIPAPEPAIFPLWVPWALAACLAVLCIVLVGFGSASHRESVELNQKLEQARQVQATLQREHDALQARVAATASTASNDAARISALEKQLAQRTLESQKQKTDADKKAQESQAEIISAKRQLNIVQSQLDQARRTLKQQGLPEANVVDPGDAFSNLRLGLLRPTTSGVTAIPDMASASATSVWDIHDQKGVLLVDKLPRLRPDQDYQLWVIDPVYPSPSSAGVFAVNENGAARLEFRSTTFPLATPQQIAISIERKGGVTGPPEGNIVMLSN